MVGWKKKTVHNSNSTFIPFVLFDWLTQAALNHVTLMCSTQGVYQFIHCTDSPFAQKVKEFTNFVFVWLLSLQHKAEIIKYCTRPRVASFTRGYSPALGRNSLTASYSLEWFGFVSLGGQSCNVAVPTGHCPLSQHSPSAEVLPSPADFCPHQTSSWHCGLSLWGLGAKLLGLTCLRCFLRCFSLHLSQL